MRKLVNICAVLALAWSASGAHARWITSWAVAPVRPLPAAAAMLPTPSFTNRTLVQTLRLSAGGKALRIRLSNVYGAAPLAIGGAHLVLIDVQGQEIAGTSRRLSFAGAAGGLAPAGGPLLSDPVEMAIPDLARLRLSLYLPGETGPCTCHSPGLDALLVSPEGDHLERPFTPEQTLGSRAFIAAVEVDADERAATIAVLGDSISDGVGSTSGANRRWPDFLAARLAGQARGRWGIANQGISGNRILSDGFGESALARLDRDILALPGITHLIVFEGVNDLGIGFGNLGNGPSWIRDMGGAKIDAGALIAGYRQIVARARGRGIKVIGATIAPYKGAPYWTEAGEAVRQEINAAIRSGAIFDGVIDFDRVFADPDDPQSMRAAYHMGDHLHGSDAGYEAAASAIDLGLFSR